MKKGTKITKVIIPVGGLGTRFLPATKAQPKTMLPIFDTPVIQKIVEEAVDAGIEEVIIVTGNEHRPIEDHFGTNEFLENLLEERGDTEKLNKVKYISSLANFVYARQLEPLGDGHAILTVKDLIKEDEAVLVLFGDDIVDANGFKNASQQLIDIYEKTGDPVVLLEKIKKEDSYKYGIIETDSDFKSDSLNITNVVEKPSPEDAPSDLGVVGKFLLTPKLLEMLSSTKPGKDGEIRLSNALSDFLSNGNTIQGKILDGVRFDTGDKLGFLKATIHFALKNDKENVWTTLQEFLNEEA